MYEIVQLVYDCVQIEQGTHNRIRTLIQSWICENPQKWAEKLIFSLFLTISWLASSILKAEIRAKINTYGEGYALPMERVVDTYGKGRLF